MKPGVLTGNFSRRTAIAGLVAIIARMTNSADAQTARGGLPMGTVFVGLERFEVFLDRVQSMKGLEIGQRVAAVGTSLRGTPYKNYTLEIDDRIEAPSVNMLGMDCWTFFEIALSTARLLRHRRLEQTPERMLRYIEIDRYWDGTCTGEYQSRLHYLEDWAADNERRGLVRDLTRDLGGIHTPSHAVEMTRNWRSYRYMRASEKVRAQIEKLEARLRSKGFYYIPKAAVAAVEPRIAIGDIICITSRSTPTTNDTSHVGLAFRDREGTLRFMHASAPRNHGKVVLDARLSDYLYQFKSHSGIMVVRPLEGPMV
jgi:hypothetical protein